MSLAALSEILAELAVVTEDAMAQAEAADAEMETLSEASERLLEQRVSQGVRSCRSDPQRAIVDMRRDLAVRVAREFVAWWADVAILAVIATVTRQSVHPALVAAADPTTWFDEEDLQHLPNIPDDVRELAGLTARLAATLLGPGQTDGDMAQRATDLLPAPGYDSTALTMARSWQNPMGQRKHAGAGCGVRRGSRLVCPRCLSPTSWPTCRPATARQRRLLLR
jgi:hypothetical protein